MHDGREYLVITFPGTTAALLAEHRCHQDGRPGRLIPLPREISAGCGLCWATDAADEEVWRAYMENAKLQFEKMVRMKL